MYYRLFVTHRRTYYACFTLSFSIKLENYVQVVYTMLVAHDCKEVKYDSLNSNNSVPQYHIEEYLLQILKIMTSIIKEIL